MGEGWRKEAFRSVCRGGVASSFAPLFLSSFSPFASYHSAGKRRTGEKNIQSQASDPCPTRAFPRDFSILAAGRATPPRRPRELSRFPPPRPLFFRASLSGRVKKKLLRLREEQREADRCQNRGIHYRAIHAHSRRHSGTI